MYAKILAILAFLGLTGAAVVTAAPAGKPGTDQCYSGIQARRAGAPGLMINTRDADGQQKARDVNTVLTREADGIDATAMAVERAKARSQPWREFKRAVAGEAAVAEDADDLIYEGTSCA
ncbi:Uu.00g017120.m01.CDS01 [Anthostomella pinea]|uniref:Uu.00g017120.m01.CDS01 n=1 Tax=Anthostomella pinea TaxID=933095 RepID=A0AAI8YQI1_9PEZI|nr:Uu.00g017120.m01.CDS01 [Anthostomella pinea]